MDQGYISSIAVSFKGKFSAGFTRSSVRENSDGVQAFGSRAARDNYLSVFKGFVSESPFYLKHDFFICRNFCNSFFKSGAHNRDSPAFQFYQDFQHTAGCLNIDSCIAGTTITGTPEPRAVVANEVTGVSSIPYAIFPMVFAVAGAIRRRSALPLSPQNSTCSTLPPSSVIAGFPVA